MTRPFRAILVLLMLTATLGCGTAPPPPTTSTSPREPAETTGPRLVASATRIDAGDLGYGQHRPYRFTVSNTGDQPLRFTVARKSCFCGEVELPTDGVAPGQKGTITINWAPRPGNEGAATLTTELETNDPRTPLLKLEVAGQINPVIHISQVFVDFHRLPAGKPAESEVKVFSTRLADFALEARASHPALQVAAVRLADAVREELGARSGYVVRITATPQLPRGLFSESLLLTVRAPGEEAREFNIPVYGELESGLFTIGPTEVEFHKPRITDADTKTVRVNFLTPADDDQVEIVKVEPAFLVCDQLIRRSGGRWEFKVSLSANHPQAAARQADRFVEGRVVLRVKTGGATTEGQVRVKWVPGDS